MNHKQSNKQGKAKPIKKKLPLKKEGVLKKKLVDIQRDILRLTKPHHKLTKKALKRMLAQHFSEHPKLQLTSSNLYLLWSHLGIFSENAIKTLVTDTANNKWGKDVMIFRARQICLAKTLLPLIIKLANEGMDFEE